MRSEYGRMLGDTERIIVSLFLIFVNKRVEAGGDNLIWALLITVKI
jgi:hypothetical protein